MRPIYSLCSAVLLPWLTACATAPSAPPQCPEPLPPLRPPKVALGQPFTEAMRSFLQGKLPEPIDYALPSTGARVGTQEPSRNEGGRLDQ